MSSSLDKLEGLLDSFELADYDLRDAELDEDLSYSSARAAQAASRAAIVALFRELESQQMPPGEAATVCNYITDGIGFHDPPLAMAYKTLLRIALSNPVSETNQK